MGFLWIDKVYVGDVRGNVIFKLGNIWFVKVIDLKMERNIC